MKAIFDAIREAKTLTKSYEGAPLAEFERRNRGHRNQLDMLALEWSTSASLLGGSWPRLDEQTRARLWTLRESLQSLLYSLFSTDSSLRRHPQWDSILDAKDDSGILVRLAADKLSSWATFDLLRDHGDFRLQLQQEQKEASWLLHASITQGRGDLCAKRTLTLPQVDFTTLRGTLDAQRQARTALQKLLIEARSFPEFSAQRQQQALLGRAQSRLSDALRDFSDSERKAIFESWTLLGNRLERSPNR